MKVLYFVHTAWPELNGISIHLHYLMKNLGEGIQPLLVPGKGVSLPGFSSMKIPLVEFWRGLGTPCDLVHVHGYSFFTALGAIMARLRSKPLVWTVHGVPKMDGRRKWLLSLYNAVFLGWLKGADAIISVSHDEKVKEWDAGRQARGLEAVHYLPNGVDTEVFKPVGAYRASKYAGYVGRLDADKGVQELMSIHSMPVLVAGPDEGMLDKLRAMGPLEYRQVPHEQIPNVYAQCRYVLLPSRYEGYPLTMLEALACGRPFLARPVGEIPSVMKFLFGEPKWEKYMLHEGEPLEAALERLEKENLEPELQGARKKIEEALSWKAVAGQTAEIYKSVLEKKQKN